MNCWDFMKCGRIPGGANATELGICPAYTDGAGQACWLVAGTFCGGRVQGTFAQKEISCQDCEFYKQFDPQHQSQMRAQFWYVAFTNTILDTVGALIVVLDPQGRIVRWNRACEQTTGFSFEEVNGRCVWDLFLIPEEIESVKTVFEDLRTIHFPNKHENHWVTKNGDRRLITWSNTVLRDDDGAITHVITTGIDITERKQTLDALQESEERARLLLNSTAEGIFGSDADANVTFANPSALRLLGFDDLSQLLGRNIHLLCHHTRADGTPYPLEDCQGRRAVQRGESIHVDDEVFWRSDGASFPVEYWSYPVRRNEAVVGAVTTFLDITERKQTTDALRESEERVRLLLNSAAESIVGVDTNGNVTFANPASLRMLGFDDPSQLLGRNMHLLCHHTRADGTPYPLEDCRGTQAILQGESIHVDDEILWRSDGTSFPMELWSYPVRRNEEVVGGVVTFVDITERKQAENRMRQNEADIRRSQAELRALAAQLISAKEEENKRLARELHDVFSQRLAVLGMEVSVLQQKSALPSDSLKKSLQKVGEEIGRLAKDVHQLSRELHPSILDDLGLTAALRAECKAFSRQHGISAEFLPTNVPDSLPGAISLSLYRIAQEGLWNVAKHAQAREVRLLVSVVDDQLVLAVEDNGKGFDRERMKAGGGLGLVSMEERARLAGGSFLIQSQPGKGTRVEVRIPLPHLEG